MVATRRSDANTKNGNSSTTSTPARDSPPPSPRTQKLIDRLKVNALPALSGGRVEEKPQGRVYHWRGTAYLVTDDTKPEWVEQEPERYRRREEKEVKKRKRGESSGVESEDEVGRGFKRQRRRASGSLRLGVSADDLLEDEIISTVSPAKKGSSRSKKRAFTSLDGATPITSLKSKHDDNTRPTKRTRRSAPDFTTNRPTFTKRRRTTVNSANNSLLHKRKPIATTKTRHKHTSRRRTTTTTTHSVQGQGQGSTDSEADAETHSRANMRRTDRSSFAGQQRESCIEAAQRRARNMGYQVDALPAERIREAEERERKRVGQAAMKSLVELVEANERAWMLQERLERMGERQMGTTGPVSTGSTATATTVHEDEDGEATVQSIPKSTPASSSSSAPPPSYAVVTTEDVESDVLEAEADTITTATLSCPPPPSSHHKHTTAVAAPHHDDRDEDVEDTNDASSLPELQQSQQEKPTARHDSLTPTTLPPTANPNRTTTTITTHSSPAPPPVLHLQPTNKAGDRLRWSLPTTSLQEGRAEEAITRGRMVGESHGARRRRIKRERAMLAAWTVEQTVKM